MGEVPARLEASGGDAVSDYYVLDGHTPAPEPDVLKWALSFENRGARRVAFTERDGVQVSTVFIGINHRFGAGPPLLFETLVFGGPLDDNMDRYSTWDEAEAGHAAMCQRVFPAVTP